MKKTTVRYRGFPLYLALRVSSGVCARARTTCERGLMACVYSGVRASEREREWELAMVPLMIVSWICMAFPAALRRARACVAPNLSHTVALSHFVNKAMYGRARIYRYPGFRFLFFFFFVATAIMQFRNCIRLLRGSSSSSSSSSLPYNKTRLYCRVYYVRGMYYSRCVRWKKKGLSWKGRERNSRFD